ncbi:uncharacterized protein VTP21DRAFT_8555 [Calcarisporiella thermophila]|uniref:uncharacterized protein n=1 Tax=Calcarisporiella thermophila TaxID=911321 RepID=UPI0037425AAD
MNPLNPYATQVTNAPKRSLPFPSSYYCDTNDVGAKRMRLQNDSLGIPVEAGNWGKRSLSPFHNLVLAATETSEDTSPPTSINRMDLPEGEGAESPSNLSGMHGEKYYVCSLKGCARKFTNATDLRVHESTHSGLRPYVCGYQGCEKAFKQISNLRTHERKHTGERPYKCGQCGKAFTQLGNLRTHEKIHLENRPYICTIDNCNRGFTQLGNLRTHQAKIHPDAWSAEGSPSNPPVQTQSPQSGRKKSNSSDLAIEATAGNATAARYTHLPTGQQHPYPPQPQPPRPQQQTAVLPHITSPTHPPPPFYYPSASSTHPPQAVAPPATVSFPFGFSPYPSPGALNHVPAPVQAPLPNPPRRPQLDIKMTQHVNNSFGVGAGSGSGVVNGGSVNVNVGVGINQEKLFHQMHTFLDDRSRDVYGNHNGAMVAAAAAAAAAAASASVEVDGRESTFEIHDGAGASAHHHGW